MNKPSFCRLIAFDCKRGFRENLVKWGVAVFLFAFLTNITIKNCLLYHEEMGYLGYLTYLFQGMEEYIKSETSIFELPVCWLLYYAYLFFLTGFYPISDLYGCGMKTLLSSGNRKKWMTSKYLWIAINIVFYFLLMLLVLLINSSLIGRFDTSREAMSEVFGIKMDSITSLQIGGSLACAACSNQHFHCFYAVYYYHLSASISRIYGFCDYSGNLCILDEAVFHWKLFNDYPKWTGKRRRMKLIYGIAACLIVSVLSVVFGYYYFDRKDIYGSIFK